MQSCNILCLKQDEVSAMELTREPPQSCEVLEQQGDGLDSEVLYMYCVHVH